MAVIERAVLNFLYRSTRPTAAVEGSRKVVVYNLGVKLITALIMVPLAVGALVGAYYAEPDERIIDEQVIVGAVAAMFVLAAVYMVNMVFLTTLKFDDHYIHVSSPLRHGYSVPWSSLTGGGYSASMMMYYVRSTDIGRIWVSPLQHGWAEFLRMAGNKMQDLRGENPFADIDA